MPTAGVIPSGARVEREIEFEFSSLDRIRLALREPDFTTAGRIEQAINRDFELDQFIAKGSEPDVSASFDRLNLILRRAGPR